MQISLPPIWATGVLAIVSFANPILYTKLNLLAFWPANAIALAVLLRTRTSTWSLLLLIFCLTELASWAFIPGARAFYHITAPANTLEVLLVAATLRSFVDSREWYVSIRWAISFAVAVVLVVGLFTAAVAVVLGLCGYLTADHGFLYSWRRMFTVDALGMVLITPVLLFWTERALRRTLNRLQWIETLGLSGLLATLSIATFQYDAPLLFLAFPLLALITLRGGLTGATIGSMILAAACAWFTAIGKGPIAELPVGVEQRVLISQLYFLSFVLATLPLAVFLTMRQELMNKLEREHGISQAALTNMAEGLCMFDAEQRLVSCNPQYRDMYLLPENLTEPGTFLGDIVEQQIASAVQRGMPDTYVGKLVSSLETRHAHGEIQLPDGRIIDIHRRSLPDGGWVCTHEDVTEQRRAAHQIAYLANHDPLTDLPNRACFRDQLQRSIVRAERGHRFALLCLDLDRFKAVNDTMGHAAGDELLRQVAGRLREAGGKNALVSRLGGDEFAILQTSLKSIDEVRALAAGVVKRLGEIFRINGADVLIGGSVGIALAPTDAVDPADLLQKGDLALYRAKADGRGTFRFFEAEMDSSLRARLVMEGELRAAARKGEFELYYQPVLDVRNGAIGSFEASIRWNHPVRGLMPPGDFIPIAEDTGLIIQIGEWAIRHACAEAGAWPDDIDIALNLSPVQFHDRQLITIVTSALAKAGLEPGRLELIVPESVLVGDAEAACRVLKGLQLLGVRISMDDFGTGYSSLSCLRRFPFDKIKINKAFVQDISKADTRAIVHAAVELSASLGMLTSAEGVETAEQRAILEAEGCANLQGHLIGYPLPGQYVANALKQHGMKSDRGHRAAG